MHISILLLLNGKEKYAYVHLVMGYWKKKFEFSLFVKLQEYSDYTFPLAVAIVLSGMYEDDLDNAEDVVYTGQGGHNLTGDKRQIRDQVLERGNLALKVCI